MNKNIIEYIIYHLPIFNNESLSLEDIIKEFGIECEAEATQEEIANIICETINKGNKNENKRN